MDRNEIIERLVRIEEKMDNHLRHHWQWYWPVALGILSLVIKAWLLE